MEWMYFWGQDTEYVVGKFRYAGVHIVFKKGLDESWNMECNQIFRWDNIQNVFKIQNLAGKFK